MTAGISTRAAANWRRASSYEYWPRLPGHYKKSTVLRLAVRRQARCAPRAPLRRRQEKPFVSRVLL
jgi:hypothetical protein